MSKTLFGRIVSTHLLIVLSISLLASNEKAVAACPGQEGYILVPSISKNPLLPGNLPSANKSKNIS